MRVAVEYSTSRKEVYNDFCKKNPSIKLSYEQWKNIIYRFSDSFRNYVLETGERCRLPFGFGEFTITKKKRKNKKTTPDGREFINLAVDWKRSKEKGKKIYNFNSHTEGYYFGWKWFKDTARILNCTLWYFKPSRTSSRLIAHYIKTDNKYQHLYFDWSKT